MEDDLLTPNHFFFADTTHIFGAIELVGANIGGARNRHQGGSNRRCMVLVDA